VLSGVDLIIDKAANVAKTGLDSADTANLHVKYHTVDGTVMVGDKPYLPPKEGGKQPNDELEEYTVVQLFKGDGKYADDVFLAVNGENCVVKRGYPVKIKKKFALILEQSYQQDIMANEYMSQKQDEFFKKANEYV